MSFRISAATLGAAAALAVSSAFAVPVVDYDANVTTAFINGTDVGNGGFTRVRNAGVELGLRGSLRFDSNNDPAGVYNSNGAGTYTFAAGHPDLSKPHPSWADATTPVWNWDWSINTNWDGSSSYPSVSSLHYQMQIDFNPGSGVGGTTFLSFDPINDLGSQPDHSFGNNGTAQGAGVEANSPSSYTTLTMTNNLVQNSWNMEFFDSPASPYPFDANMPGDYTITLSALDGTNSVVASTSIDVVVQAVPEASSLLAVGLAGAGSLGLVWLRRKRAAAA
jgi:hypothetical protein